MSLLVSFVVTTCISFIMFDMNTFFILHLFLFEELHLILSYFDMCDRQTVLSCGMLACNALCSNYYMCVCFIGSRDKKTPLDMVTQALNIFLQTKQSLNLHHEFALMFLDNCAQWVSTDLVCVNSQPCFILLLLL